MAFKIDHTPSHIDRRPQLRDLVHAKIQNARKASALIRTHIESSCGKMVAAAGERLIVERSRRSACASEPRKQ